MFQGAGALVAAAGADRLDPGDDEGSRRLAAILTVNPDLLVSHARQRLNEDRAGDLPPIEVDQIEPGSFRLDVDLPGDLSTSQGWLLTAATVLTAVSFERLVRHPDPYPRGVDDRGYR